MAFFLAWDTEAHRIFSQLKPQAIAVFSGCLPCSTHTFPVADSFALTSTAVQDSFARRILEKRLPPPASVVACGTSSITGRRDVLNCVVSQKNAASLPGSALAADTLPFLFTGIFENRTIIAVTAKNIWPLEFLPLGIDQENETSSFTRELLALAKQQLAAGINRAFFFYAENSSAHEYDSSYFIPILPADIEKAAAPGSPQRIDFSLSSGKLRLIDTVFSIVPAAHLTPILSCRPLPPGTYPYSASMTAQGKRHMWGDTLFVRNDDLEYAIFGQNTILLDQTGLPVSPIDTAEIASALSETPGQLPGETESHFFQISQSWPMFIILIALLTAEWALRRKNGLDS
jgi:hypothetical protein